MKTLTIILTLTLLVACHTPAPPIEPPSNPDGWQLFETELFTMKIADGWDYTDLFSHYNIYFGENDNLDEVLQIMLLPLIEDIAEDFKLTDGMNRLEILTAIRDYSVERAEDGIFADSQMHLEFGELNGEVALIMSSVEYGVPQTGYLLTDAEFLYAIQYIESHPREETIEMMLQTFTLLGD